MNPNMVYAQIRPGIDRIRGTGIIDARRFIGAFNGASLIRNSEHWSGGRCAKSERLGCSFCLLA